MKTPVEELYIERYIKAVDEEYYKHKNWASTKIEMDSGDVSALFAVITDEINWMAEKLNKYLPKKYETFGAQKYCLVTYAVRKFSELVSFRVDIDNLAKTIRNEMRTGNPEDRDFKYFKDLVTYCVLDMGYGVKESKRGRWNSNGS